MRLLGHVGVGKLTNILNRGPLVSHALVRAVLLGHKLGGWKVNASSIAITAHLHDLVLALFFLIMMPVLVAQGMGCLAVVFLREGPAIVDLLLASVDHLGSL